MRFLDTPEWKALVAERTAAPPARLSRATWDAASLKVATSDAPELIELVEKADPGQAQLAHGLLIQAERAGRAFVAPELKVIWIAKFFEREQAALSEWLKAPSSDSLSALYDRVICHLPPGTLIDQVIARCGPPTSGGEYGSSHGPSCWYSTEDAEIYIGADLSGVVVGWRYA